MSGRRSNPKPTPNRSEQIPTLLSPNLPVRFSSLDAEFQHPQPTATPATNARIEKLIGRPSMFDESYANSKTKTPANQARPPNETALPRSLINIAEIYTAPRVRSRENGTSACCSEWVLRSYIDSPSPLAGTAPR